MKYNVLQAMVFFGKASREESKNRQYVEEVIDFMELEPYRKSRVGNLSYGVQKRVEVARALTLGPKLLLLDEPMAGMGVDESRSLTDLLNSLRDTTTMLLVEHDMDVVFSLADEISVLVYGKIIATDTPEAIRSNRDVQEAYLGTHELHKEEPA